MRARVCLAVCTCALPGDLLGGPHAPCLFSLQQTWPRELVTDQLRRTTLIIMDLDLGDCGRLHSVLLRGDATLPALYRYEFEFDIDYPYGEAGYKDVDITVKRLLAPAALPALPPAHMRACVSRGATSPPATGTPAFALSNYSRAN